MIDPCPLPCSSGPVPKSPASSGDFDRFWAAYPRKVGKQEARRAFAAVRAPVETLLCALERQRDDPQWKREQGRYIPHPATWLRQGRWEDESPIPAADCRTYGVECL